MTAAVRDKVWVGVDVGKTHHWMCAVDGQGTRLLSRKVLNDEAEIMRALEAISALAPERVWAVDIIGAPSALLLALLAASGTSARYASGRVVAAMRPPTPAKARTATATVTTIAAIPSRC